MLMLRVPQGNIIWLILVLVQLKKHAAERRANGIKTNTIGKMLNDEPKRTWFCFHFGEPCFLPPVKK
jgi:hypothetical protein